MARLGTGERIDEVCLPRRQGRMVGDEAPEGDLAPRQPDEPMVLCSEVDDDGWERRKVDEYRDGRLDRADAESEAGTTRLADRVMPSLEELNFQGPFEAAAISSDEFEALWLRAAPRC